jgi:hypothetical protein
MSANQDALMQALHDPENQPSQFGTVPMWMAEASRRERIATAALQGYLASFAGVPQTSMTPEGIAAQAVEFADALIAELDKEPQR